VVQVSFGFALLALVGFEIGSVKLLKVRRCVPWAVGCMLGGERGGLYECCFLSACFALSLSQTDATVWAHLPILHRSQIYSVSLVGMWFIDIIWLSLWAHRIDLGKVPWYRYLV
jgi:hypothetical protein